MLMKKVIPDYMNRQDALFSIKKLLLHIYIRNEIVVFMKLTSVRTKNAGAAIC